MTGKTHAAAGLITSLLVMNYNNHINHDTYDLLSGILIGSLALDIDTKQSFISNAFPPVAWIIGKFTKHRGVIHILLPFVLIGLYYFYWHKIFLLWLGIGGFTHIVVDLIGHIFGITCNSKGESAIYVILWICVFGYIGNLICIKYNIHIPKPIMIELNTLKHTCYQCINVLLGNVQKF
jgi:hypothetical protein